MKFLSIIAVLLFTSLSQAGELAYVKTDSPRDTMDTFMRAMNDYRQGVLSKDLKKMSRIKDAIRCFASRPNSIITSQREKELNAILLKEAIDRVIVVDFDKIPSDPNGSRWRLKNTEIVLKPEAQGERQGEWLITEGTWRRSKEFYDRVKDLPYLKGSGQGASYIDPWMETYLPKWSKREILGLKNWQWLGLFIGIFLGLLVRLLVQLVILVYSKLSFTRNRDWKQDLLTSIEKPLGLLCAAVFWYAWIYYLKLEGLPFSIVNGFIQIIFGVAFTWAAYLLVSVVAKSLRKKAMKTESTLDDQLIPFFEKAIKLLVILLGILIVLQNMGFNVYSLLAGLGLGGLAFALAAQDTAANLFGSIMILVDRPFKIGDWIIVSGVEGTVEEIGFRSTRIRTFYNSLITVPNADMASAKIDNMGMRDYRRTRTELDIAYETPLEKVEQFVQGVRDIIKANDITQKDSFHVYFSGYGESSLKILVLFHLATQEYGRELTEKQSIFMEIFKLAETLGVEFAYPTRTLFLKNDCLPETKSKDL